MIFSKCRLKVSSFKKRYKGYLKLIEQNNLSLWRELKEDFLLFSPLKNGSKFSELIFGSTHEFAELIIHQFCIDKFLPTWLNGQILENISDLSSKVNIALPNKWHSILIAKNLRVNNFGCNIKFYFSIILVFCFNIKLILKIILKSFKNKIPKNFNNSVYFHNLQFNNLPLNGSNKSYDLISWYIESKAFINGVNKIYHDVYERKTFTHNFIQIQSNNLPSDSLNNKSNILSFIFWAIKSIFISMIDLIRGKWWHPLILGEAAKNKVIELKSKQELCIAYYFNYSAECYRPMWTYSCVNKGVEIISYFYSTFEQPTLQDKINNQKFQFYLYNWPKSLLWDDRQKNLLQNSCKFNLNAVIVGPIFMVDSNEIVAKNKFFNVVVFDSQLHKKFYHFGTSTLSDYYEYNPNTDIRFLKDILQISKTYNLQIIHKTKRNIGNRSVNSYKNLLKNLQFEKNYTEMDSMISPLKLIENADIIFSSPFTSTALYASYLNKPSFFYDPTGWIQKDDPAAHGIPVISGITELTQIIENILKKNLSLNLLN